MLNPARQPSFQTPETALKRQVSGRWPALPLPARHPRPDLMAAFGRPCGACGCQHGI